MDYVMVIKSWDLEVALIDVHKSNKAISNIIFYQICLTFLMNFQGWARQIGAA